MIKRIVTFVALSLVVWGHVEICVVVTGTRRSLADRDSPKLFYDQPALLTLKYCTTLNARLMPPLRPSLYPRYLGYVCPLCIAKLQAPRRPPWQIRNAATQSKPDGREGKIRQKKTQADIKLADDDVIVKHYDQGLDGTLEPAEDDLPDDTLEDLKSRIAALEADLQKFKAGRSIPEGKSLIDQMLNSKPPSTSDASFHQPANGKSTLRFSILSILTALQASPQLLSSPRQVYNIREFR